MHFIIANVSHLQNEIRIKKKAYGAAPEVLSFSTGGSVANKNGRLYYIFLEKINSLIYIR